MGLVGAKSFCQDLDGAIEPDDFAGVAEDGLVCRVEDRPTAERNDLPGCIGDRTDRIAFDPAKIRFAFALEKRGDRLVEGGFDLVVGIDPIESECGSKERGNGSLSAAAISDQVEIRARIRHT